ncbi:hypothetical protein [Sphingomonas sp. dw_22]|uniref:hypothetical protein n=1 Tax=Sphingomonas sp. dw_22 TaxID=2721175 RepID=UPI001BD4FC17|nr:hypothetical protein [Sphingomonas sp. dw_22]
MRKLLEELKHTEGGRRFLVNLFDGMWPLEDLPSAIARQFLTDVGDLATHPSGPKWHRWQPHFLSIAFGTPETFQYKGPEPLTTEGQWMTVKSAADIGELIRSSPWIDPVAADRRFSPYDLKAIPNTLRDADYEQLAANINDPLSPLRFRLARAFRRTPRARPRPAPVWASRWGEFAMANPGLPFPSTQSAGRVRDWLGLPYDDGTALFLIRARAIFNAKRHMIRRPTILDGIANPLFKHRVDALRQKEGCGSTADLYRLRSAPSTPDMLDGGPEVVARRMWFHPLRFECVYIGKAPAIDYDIFGDHLHVRLLDARDLSAMVDHLEVALT